MAKWLDVSGVNDDYDYIIFDCPPATKLVSQNALAASDYYLIPVIPDEMSSRSVNHFKHLVKNRIDAKLELLKTSANISQENVPNSYVAKTKIDRIVPFIAKPVGAAYSGLINLHTRQISDLRNSWNDKVLNNIVNHYAGVAKSMNNG